MVHRAYYQMGMVSLFAVLLWVSVSVYLALVGSSDVAVDKDLLSPVPPFTDTATVASISGRTQVGANAVILVGDIVPATPSASPVSTARSTIAPSPSPSPASASASAAPAESDEGVSETSEAEF
jgi:hypothetical protein